MTESFDGIVRGYQVIGPGLHLVAVIVEADPSAEVPESGRLLKYGELTRGDGVVTPRAVGVVGDWRPCSELVAELIDRPVTVTLGPDGSPYIRAAGGDIDRPVTAEPGEP